MSMVPSIAPCRSIHHLYRMRERVHFVIEVIAMLSASEWVFVAWNSEVLSVEVEWHLDHVG